MKILQFFKSFWKFTQFFRENGAKNFEKLRIMHLYGGRLWSLPKLAILSQTETKINGNIQFLENLH